MTATTHADTANLTPRPPLRSREGASDSNSFPLNSTSPAHTVPNSTETHPHLPLSRLERGTGGEVRTRALILLLAFFAFAASLAASRQVFERVPHLEDEVAYLFQAKVFARGQLTADVISPRSAYWQPFVIEHSSGTRFGKYPPGWPMLLASGVMLGLPAWVNAALAALTVILTYRLGREAFGRDVGVISAALVTFSPMALLLNGTLMAHTAALFGATGFMWAYLRMARLTGRPALWCGALSGVMLGIVVTSRPLSAVAVAAPFIVWSGVRLILAVITPHPLTPPRPLRERGPEGEGFHAALLPLIALSIAALLVSALIPIYNAAATGDLRADLYTLVPGWEYDRLGFGPDIGRNGHTLTKGVQFARYDLSLTAADLFGWQLSGWTDMLTEWAVGIAPSGMVADSYWPVLGLSWVLLPLGLIVGFGRDWAYIWALFGILWVLVVDSFLFTAIELWALFGILWALFPLAMIVRDKSTIRALEPSPDVDTVGTPYIASASPTSDQSNIHTTNLPLPTWLLFAVVFALIAAHTAYWIGSQRYSTRYYAEGLSAAALLSALPLAWLMRQGRVWRVIVPVGLVAALAWSYFGYSIPRISALRGYNRVTREVIGGVMARIAPEGGPVLVLVSGEDARWRTRGALWTLGSPLLDADIETAYVDPLVFDSRNLILDQFPGRQIIEMGVSVNDLWFIDTCADGVCDLANPPVNPTLLLPAVPP